MTDAPETHAAPAYRDWILLALLAAIPLTAELAGLTVGLSPVLLAMSSFYSMNAFEPLLWMLIVLAIVHIIQTGRSRM